MKTEEAIDVNEILFRGKRIDNNEWIYGFLYIGPLHTFIIPLDADDWDIEAKAVIPKSVAQYIGISDNHDRKIFRGDILYNPRGKKEDFNNGIDEICLVEYDLEYCRYYLIFFSIAGEEGSSSLLFEGDQIYKYVKEGWYVGSNIFDNPELKRI